MKSSNRITAASGDAAQPKATGHPRGRWGRMPAALLAVLALGALSLALAGPAVAAELPAAATGGAHSVSYGSAVLSGTLNPKGSDTSYYFQYGITRSYGGQTAIADAGAGSHSVNVELPVGGLQPITVYHYRLVAVNAAGASIGSDRTLLTTKVPLSLQILSSPNPVLFGGLVTVQGTLSGTNNGGRTVVLQGNTFPFSAGFQDVGNPELTTASGGFSFLIAGLGVTTQYRVVTTTTPAVVSPVAVQNVAVQVASHIGRSRLAHHIRFYGTVSPAEDGAQVAILRIVHGRGVLVGGTTLVHLDAGRSRFNRPVPTRRGVYRVLVRVTNGAQLSNYGQPLVIR
jgi:hypothetical protein